MPPYVGEIRMFAGNFAPDGWMFCEGQELSIAEYETLFMLIGTTYGGDGQTTFVLPDLRGRIPVHMGNAVWGETYPLGAKGGQEEVTLTVGQMPAHSHRLLARREQGNTSNPEGAVPAMSTLASYTAPGQPAAGQMHAAAAGPVGGNQPHTNMMPYLCVNFIISLYGIYPSQT
ncbi:phage tail protein [Paenibacillus sambharensis]|uniref:Phage tail protein n=1 Tax=Paenibacillus sambharensis TaxID=1803190 RepID=A0A2W1LHJ6_9BACL|nr:tail fiber protein [Paenibacillus sambharensis]PZD94522.1 phage tail protein [Paenibacillus sambharensis]